MHWSCWSSGGNCVGLVVEALWVVGHVGCGFCGVVYWWWCNGDMVMVGLVFGVVVSTVVVWKRERYDDLSFGSCLSFRFEFWFGYLVLFGFESMTVVVVGDATSCSTVVVGYWERDTKIKRKWETKMKREKWEIFFIIIELCSLSILLFKRFPLFGFSFFSSKMPLHPYV